MEEKVVWHVSSANFGKEQLWKCAMFVKVPRVWRVDEDNSSLSTQAHKYTRTQEHKYTKKLSSEHTSLCPTFSTYVTHHIVLHNNKVSHTIYITQHDKVSFNYMCRTIMFRTHVREFFDWPFESFVCLTAIEQKPLKFSFVRFRHLRKREDTHVHKFSWLLRVTANNAVHPKKVFLKSVPESAPESVPKSVPKKCPKKVSQK